MNNFNEIKSRNEIADFLNIPIKKLTCILYEKKPDNYYSSFSINKKSGGIRIINAPVGDLKDVQVKLAGALYEHKDLMSKTRKQGANVSHGFEKKRGIITNAKYHVNKKFILNIDLENFFGSFHFGRVRGYFEKNRDFNLPIVVATIMAQLTCYKGVLPQGAPTSPVIANMICCILDSRLVKLAKEFKLYYTRYADDLTFSTNDKEFLKNSNKFLKRIKFEVEKFGLSINDKKTRLIYNDSRQEVTGLVVNKKVNINNGYYKITRAMAEHLYTNGEFVVNGKTGQIDQLEGRFAFINQIDRHNNIQSKKKKNFWNLNGREKEYRKFLFYRYFVSNDKPLIITEGKTDPVYIKAALKNLYKSYPELIEKKENKFFYKLTFLKRTKRMRYFLNIHSEGGDTLTNVYNLYTGKNNHPNYLKFFENKKKINYWSPVFLLFDNEQRATGKPLKKFKCKTSINSEIDLSKHIVGNLYIITNPLVKNLNACEIEDLFDDVVLATKLNNKTFSRDEKFDNKRYYGKKFFSDYVMKNYRKIDFDAFKPLLDEIRNIIRACRTGSVFTK